MTTKTLSIFELTGKRALVTREVARGIGRALAESVAEGQVTLDFAGVEAVTPSFVDETLAVLEETVRRLNPDGFRVVFLNPPTRLSSKFAAIGRGRDLEFEESASGAWIITPVRPAV